MNPITPPTLEEFEKPEETSRSDSPDAPEMGVPIDQTGGQPEAPEVSEMPDREAPEV